MKNIMTSVVLICALLLSGCAVGKMGQQSQNAAYTLEDDKNVIVEQDTKRIRSIAGSEENKETKQLVIGATLAAESVYLSTVSTYMQEAAREKNVDLQLLYADWDVNTQIEQIENFIVEGVDAIILTPVNAKSMLAPIKKAKAKGIPIINLNMKVDGISSEYIDTYIGASSSEEAAKAADLFVELLEDEGGKVAIVEGSPGSDPQIYRTQTFVEKLTSNPQIEIVSIGCGDWKRDKAKLVAHDILQNNPEIKAIYCHDSEMAMGVIEALNEEGLTEKPLVVSIGENEEALQEVRDGRLAGIVTQPADYEGKYSVYCAILAANGGTLRPWYKDPIETITIENVENYKRPME